MKRYSIDETLHATGARPEELAAWEARGLLVPNRRRRFLGKFGGGEDYYTEAQIEVLRWLLRTRRAMEAGRR